MSDLHRTDFIILLGIQKAISMLNQWGRQLTIGIKVMPELSDF